jgi:hypothetical protein
MIGPSQGLLTKKNKRDIHAQAGFEPEIPTREPPQTHPLDCMATGISGYDIPVCVNKNCHEDFKVAFNLPGL